MSKIVNGASLQPRSGLAPKQIVILLHGYGSSGSDLIALAPHWQDALPDALFLAPPAPQRCGTMSAGYQWWALSELNSSALAAGTASAAPAVTTFIDRKLEQYGLTDADLALVGFSQGTMMALHVGLRRSRPVSGIVGYSGMLTATTELEHKDFVKPPVLLVHGTADPVVPVAALQSAETELKRLGVPVTTHLSDGLGHNVDAVGLQLGRDFLVEALAQAR
ncbi:alpha/beta hydrolase [Novosphingopyxis sp.]|uniref:alpha/beta hydrolase n=1 Tax=Novosphingopyxis sp. TaxID=2709690 RepID=UPI003B5914F0